MRYLLDSDWIIHLLAGRKDLADRIQHLAPEDIAICLVTVAEVYEEALPMPIRRRIYTPFANS